MIQERLIPARRLRAALGALAFSSIASVAVLYTRPLIFGKTGFGYLPTNLLLAWVPLLSALAAYRFYNRVSKPWLLVAACAGVWFIFFPNAPYILTDLVHLRERKGVPIWFDVIINLNFCLTGLFAGWLSLHLMHEIVEHRAGRRLGWVFALCMLGLSGFGIYLGRFLRWNSWDIARRPGALLRDIGGRFADPLSQPGPLAFWLLISLLLGMTYVVIHALTHLHEPPAGRAGKDPE